MSRHHHKTQSIQPKQNGKKEQERQRRIRQAKQRMRIHTFTALALLIFEKWEEVDLLQKGINSLSANERRFWKMSIAKCHKSIKKVVTLLHKDTPFPAPGSQFFIDAAKWEQDLLSMLIHAPSMPDMCMHIDVFAMLTYIIYAAMREWQVMERRMEKPNSLCDAPEVCDMIRNIGIFGDHIIPVDSKFILPMNEVFWATRESLHAGAPLPIWDFSICPPSHSQWVFYPRKEAA